MFGIFSSRVVQCSFKISGAEFRCNCGYRRMCGIFRKKYALCLLLLVLLILKFKTLLRKAVLTNFRMGRNVYIHFLGSRLAVLAYLSGYTLRMAISKLTTGLTE
jgi:hypothetical protein